MKKMVIYTLSVLTLIFPTICLADSAIQGPYMSGFIGVNGSEDQDVSSTDYITNGTYSDRIEFDPGSNIGLTGGYDFGVVRLEGELSYKNAEIKSITNQIPSERFHNASGDIGVTATMFNAFMNIYNSSPVTPYFGGGIGLATIILSDTRGTRIVNGTSNRELIYGSGNDTVFAYQVGGGVDIALNRHFSLDVGYRYFITNRANIDSDQEISTNLEFATHTASIGFRYKY